MSSPKIGKRKEGKPVKGMSKETLAYHAKNGTGPSRVKALKELARRGQSAS